MADELTANPISDDDDASTRNAGAASSTFDVDGPTSFENEVDGDAGEKDQGDGSPRAALTLGLGTGWQKLQAAVALADVRPVLDEAEVLAKHAQMSGADKPVFVIDPRSDFWKLWCLTQGVVIMMLMFWVPFVSDDEHALVLLSFRSPANCDSLVCLIRNWRLFVWTSWSCARTAGLLASISATSQTWPDNSSTGLRKQTERVALDLRRTKPRGHAMVGKGPQAGN